MFSRFSIGAGIAALVLLCFGHAGTQTALGLADTLYTEANAATQSGITLMGLRYAFAGFDAGAWQPVAWLSHMLDYQIWDTDLGMHHWTSLVLHAATSVLLFHLLWVMTGAVGRSAVAALLFAVHPLRVESAVWLGDRNGLLAGLFWAAAMLAWTRYVKEPQQRRKWWIVATLCCALGVMAKPVVALLPLVLVAVEFWPLGRWKYAAEAVRGFVDKLPLLALGAVAVALNARAFSTSPLASLYPAQDAAARTAGSLHALAQIVAETFWPAWFGFQIPARAHSGLELVGAALLITALTALALRRPAARTGWLWFLIVLVPSVAIQTGDYAFAARDTYIPHMGFAVALVWTVHGLLKPAHLVSIPFRAGVAVAVAVLAWTAYARTPNFSHPIPLWIETLKNYPEHPLASAELGRTYVAQQEIARARPLLQKAIALRPNLAEPYRLLSQTYSMEGKPDEALRWINKAGGKGHSNAQLAYDRGVLLRDAKRLDEAAAEFEQALKLGLPGPLRTEAYFLLGRIDVAKENDEKAIGRFRAALELNPHHYMARKNLALCYMSLKQFDKAETEVNGLVLVDPEDEEIARVNRFLKNRVK
jgi:Tfp pilus assembly protein PilF